MEVKQIHNGLESVKAMSNAPKTYRAIRHDVVREQQRNNDNSVHHPDEKIDQIRRILLERAGWCDLSILELFAGHGNLTKIYAEFGEVIACEYKQTVFEKLQESTRDLMLVQCHRANSFVEFHAMIASKQRFDVIDLDPYGFPNRFFPDIFLLIDKGVLFVTMPKPSVNILNGITASHLTSYYGEQNPSLATIVGRIALWGLCHWRQVELIDAIDLKSVWRLCFEVSKVKATEYTGVKNQPYERTPSAQGQLF